MHRVFSVVALLAVLAACSNEGAAPQPSLGAVVNDGGDPASAWVVSTSGVPDRPAFDGDWAAWAASAGATPLSARTVLLTTQAKVTAVRVKVVAKRPAIAGTQYVLVSPEPVADERLDFDLDASPGAKQVQAAEGSTFAVTVQTQQCDCDWVVELDWAGGTATVDDHGKPFRVSASTATVGRCVTYPDKVEKCEKF